MVGMTQFFIPENYNNDHIYNTIRSGMLCQRSLKYNPEGLTASMCNGLCEWSKMEAIYNTNNTNPIDYLMNAIETQLQASCKSTGSKNV